MGRPGCRSCCGTITQYPAECLTPVGIDYYNFGDGFKDSEDYIQYLLEQGQRGLFGLGAHKKVLPKKNTHEYKTTLTPFTPKYVKLPDVFTQGYTPPKISSYAGDLELYMHTPWQQAQADFFSGGDTGVVLPKKWSVNFSGGYQLVSEIIGFDATTHNLEPSGQKLRAPQGFDIIDYYDFNTNSGRFGLLNPISIEPGGMFSTDASRPYLDSMTSLNMRIQIERQNFTFERYDNIGAEVSSYFKPDLRKTKVKHNIVWTRTLLSPTGEVLYAQKNRVPYKEVVDIYGTQVGDFNRSGAIDSSEIGSEQHMYRIIKNNCFLPIPTFLAPVRQQTGLGGIDMTQIPPRISSQYYVSAHMMNLPFEAVGEAVNPEVLSANELGFTSFDINTRLGRAQHPAAGLGLSGYLACTYCLGHNYSIMNYYHAEQFDGWSDYGEGAGYFASPAASTGDFTATYGQQLAEMVSLDTSDPKSLFGHTTYGQIPSSAFTTAEIVTEGWVLVNPYGHTLDPLSNDDLSDLDRKSNADVKTPMIYAVNAREQRFVGGYWNSLYTDRDDNVRLTPTDEEFDIDDIEDYPILTDEEVERIPISGKDGYPAWPALDYSETPEIWQELWKIQYRGMARHLLGDINSHANIGSRDNAVGPLGLGDDDDGRYATKLGPILTPDQLLTRHLNSSAMLPHTIEMQKPKEGSSIATGDTEMIKYVAKVSKDVAYGLKRVSVVTSSNTTQLCFISTDNYPAVRSAQVIRHSTNLNYDGAIFDNVIKLTREQNFAEMSKIVWDRMREEPAFKLWGEALGILTFGQGGSTGSIFSDTDPNVVSRNRIPPFPLEDEDTGVGSPEVQAFGLQPYGEYYHLAPIQVPIAGGSKIIGIGNKDLTVGDMVIPTDRPADDTSLWVITQVKATKKDEDAVYYIRKLSNPEEGTIISEKNVVRPDREYQQGFYWSSLGVLNLQTKYLSGEHADPTMYRVTNIELFAGGASLSMTRPGAIRFYSIQGKINEDGVEEEPRRPSYANRTYTRLPDWRYNRRYLDIRSVEPDEQDMFNAYKGSKWNEYITISPQMSAGVSGFPTLLDWQIGWQTRGIYQASAEASTGAIAYRPEATFTVFFSPKTATSVKHTCAFPYDPTKEPPNDEGLYQDGSRAKHGPTIHYEAKIFPNKTLPSETLTGDGYKLCYNDLNKNSLYAADRFAAHVGRSYTKSEAQDYMWYGEILSPEKYGDIFSARRSGDSATVCDRGTSGIIVQNGVYFNLTDDIQIKFTLEPVGGNNPELENRRKVGVDMSLPEALRAGRKNPTLEEDKDNPLLIGVFDPPDPQLDHTAGLKIPKMGGGHMTLPVNLWQGHTASENQQRQAVLGCVKMPDYTTYEVKTGGLPEEIIKKIPPAEIEKSTFQDFDEAIDTLNGNSIIIADEPSPIWTSVPVDLGKISDADLDQLVVDGLDGPKLDYSNQIDRMNKERSDNTETLPEINSETKLEIGTEVYVAFPTMWSITAQAQNPYPEGLYGVRSPYSKLPDVLDYRYFAYAEYKGKLYPVLKGIILKVASISTEEEIDSNANQDQVLDRISLTNGAKHILEFSRSEDYGWGTKVEDLWTGTQNLLPESYEGERKSYINFYKEMPQAGFFHVPAGGSAWAQLFPVDECEILNPKDNT